MSGVIATIPKYQFSASDGTPLASGTLTTYLAGTTTLSNTWQDSALTSANTNPITLDSRGECVLWLDDTKVYKFVLKNAAGVTQWTVDNVSGADGGLRVALAASGGSALVGYLAAGSGAVATTVQTKLRESVSVKDFGAVGDGVTDDTAAISLAIASSATSIIFPNGTYKVTSPITVGGKSLIGQSTTNTIISYSGNITVFLLSSNSSLSKLTITHTGAAATSGDAITINGSSVFVSRVIVNFAFNAITVVNSQNTAIKNCTLWCFVSNGILINGNCNDNFIEDCFINGGTGNVYPSDVGTASVGINLVNKTDASFIRSCEVILCNIALLTSCSDTTHRPGYLVVENSYFDSSTSAASLADARIMSFIGCWFNSRTGPGVTLTNCSGIRFSTCTFAINAQHGLVIQSSCVDVLVDSCVFEGNGVALTNTYSGIAIAASTSNFSITNCVSGNNSLMPTAFLSATQKYGVSIGSGCSNFIVSNNNLLNNISAPFLDSSSATAEKYICYNVGGTSNFIPNLLDISGSSAGQIKFPSTQNPSSNVNTLDDYKEGTFVPVLTCATVGDLAVTYTSQAGTFTKIGRQVTVSFQLVTSSFTHTTASGVVSITGLPYESGSSFLSTGAVIWAGITRASTSQITAQVPSGASTVGFQTSNSGSSVANIVITDMPTGGTIALRATITYNV